MRVDVRLRRRSREGRVVARSRNLLVACHWLSPWYRYECRSRCSCSQSWKTRLKARVIDAEVHFALAAGGFISLVKDPDVFHEF